MKLTIILLTTFLLQVHATAVSQTVTLSGSNMGLERVFESVKKQTGYRFFYDVALLRNTGTVTVRAADMPLESFLKEIFSQQPLDYTIKNKTILISPRPARNDPASGYSGLNDFRDITVTGRVVNAEGLPLAGANVVIKGRSRGVITDKNGEFTLSDVDEKSVLIISYTGFETVEIPAVSNLKTIQLKVSSANFDEVVITNGYQKIERRKLTSAITTVKAADIVNPGMFTIDQALEGRVPGLFVLNNSGDIGVAPKIRIRGTSTILGNREPLWVVDGVVVNDPVGIDPSTINDLDFVNRLGNAISGLKPFDIEQIDVLKDASATALYGVRAANGVIVITTKKGKTGDAVVNFNQSTTFTRRPRYTDHNIHLMDSRERIDYSRDLVKSGLNYSNDINYVGYEGALTKLYSGKYTYDQFQQEVHRLETVNTDWFGIILQDAVSTQNNLSVSGGTSKLNYFASVGAATQRGTLTGDKLDQYTALVKLNAYLTPKLNWELNLRGNVQKSDFVAGSVNALSYAYNTSRAIPGRNEDGSLFYYERFSPTTNYIDYFNFNIENEMQHSRNTIDNSGINLTTNLNLKFNQRLNGTLLLSYGNNNSNDQTVYDENTFYAAGLRRSEYGVVPVASRSYMPYGGELKSNQIRNQSYLVRGQLNYDQPIGRSQRDNLNITLGSEMSSNKYKGYTLDRRSYMSDRGQTFAPVDPVKYPLYAQWAMLQNVDVVKNGLTNIASGYFSGSYTINDKYILNFNTRTDFSNKFGSRSKEKFLPTWSVSGRWDVDKDFFQGSKIVNMLAFKASYGFQGNMLDNQSPDLIIKQGSIDPITTEYYSTIAYYPNPNLKWEKNKQVNLGLDFSLFNNKIQGTLNYFYKRTTNAFLDKQVANINGQTTYVVNSGTIENKGVEVALSFTPINNMGPGGNKGGFTWRVDPQLGQVINKLISKGINNGLRQNLGQKNANLYGDFLAGKQIIDGKAANTFYSYQFTGLDHQLGYPTFHNDDPALADKYKGVKLEDVIGQVMVASGNRIPTIEGGILNVFSYKQFSMSFNLTYSIGSKVRMAKLYSNYKDGIITSSIAAPLPQDNVNPIFTERWRQPGDEAHTNIPGLIAGSAYNSFQTHWSIGQTYEYASNIWEMYDNSDIRVVSGNYLKLKTMNFRYAISDRITKRLRLKQTSVMLSGTNLYTWASSKLNGQDPEQAGFGNSTQLSPRPTYSLTLDVSF